ncbi:hypothetical protein Tco_0231412 [Tanacetum coccineum]
MSTRSSARRLLSPIEDPERLLSRRNRSEPSLLFNLEEDDMAGQAPPQGLIPDLRSKEELLQAPTDGVGDWKRIFKKRTKTKLKTDKTEHGMEKCEKTKSNRSQSQSKSNSQQKSQPRQSQSQPREAESEEYKLEGPKLPIPKVVKQGGKIQGVELQIK